MLHGDHSSLPNWESRVRIAVGAARGIAHIHAQCEGKLAHGNIKSSNIFVNPQRYGCVSDLGMWGIGVKNTSQECDVYKFGLLLVELITGKSRVEASYIVRHLHSFEVYEFNFRWSETRPMLLVDELDMLKARSFGFLCSMFMDSEEQQEVRRTLQVAKRCLSLIREERPRMCEMVLEIEKIAELSAQRYRNQRVDNKKL